MEQWLLILSSALIASVVAAIAGTGGGIILLPVLVAIFGVRDAVPMYAVAQLVGNLSRVGFNRRFIQLPVVFWFVAGAIPFSILGAWLFTKLPDTGLLRILGGFLICSVIWRHWRGRLITGFRPHWFAPIVHVFFGFCNFRQCRSFSCAVLSFIRAHQGCVHRNRGFRDCGNTRCKACLLSEFWCDFIIYLGMWAFYLSGNGHWLLRWKEHIREIIYSGIYEDYRSCDYRIWTMVSHKMKFWQHFGFLKIYLLRFFLICVSGVTCVICGSSFIFRICLALVCLCYGWANYR